MRMFVVNKRDAKTLIPLIKNKLYLEIKSYQIIAKLIQNYESPKNLPLCLAKQ